MVALSTTQMVILFIVLKTMTRKVAMKFISWISEAKSFQRYAKRYYNWDFNSYWFLNLENLMTSTNFSWVLLFLIILQNLLAFRGWNGYICSSINIKEEKLWFQVKKYYRMLTGDLACKVTVGYDKYWIVRMTGKVAFRVVNINGDIIAEVSIFLLFFI